MINSYDKCAITNFCVQVLQYCFYFLQAGSPFHEPLLKFLLRYPSQAVDMFLRDSREPQWYRFFEVSLFSTVTPL